MEESLFYESSKSFMESPPVDQLATFKLITIRKGGKRFGRTKVFNSNDNEHLQREMTSKKVGMDVLWRAAASSNSLEYPAYKTLRELCYSMVEDKSGE
jgi:hypothetical protein